MAASKIEADTVNVVKYGESACKEGKENGDVGIFEYDMAQRLGK